MWPGLAWVDWTLGTTLAILAVVGFVSFIWWGHHKMRRTWARLATSRPYLGEQQFIDAIAADGGDREAATFIRKFLVDWSLPEFSPYPDDDLGRIYYLYEEERDEDLILGAIEAAGLPQPPQRFADDFGPVDSPLQVARFVARWRAASV